MLRVALLLTVLAGAAAAQAPQPAHAPRPALEGTWVINPELSDDTDKQIEKTVRKAGGRIDSGGKRGKGRYRGGPPDQELYDRMAYDDVLIISQATPEHRFTYADDFTRVFHSDGRAREISASGAHQQDMAGFAFASWDGATLRVEARPPDGGWTREIYTLEPGGQQLRAELEVKPLTFIAPLKLVRIYDRGK